jgi:phosphoribosylformylglycinamidine synthase
VTDALHALGFPEVDDTRIGRHLIIDVTADSAAAAEASVKAMCDKLLANPVTEDYQIALTVTT